MRRLKRPYKHARYIFKPRARGTSARQQREWRARYNAEVDLAADRDHLLAYIEAIAAPDEWSNDVYNNLVRRLARAGHPILPKAQLRRGYRALVAAGAIPEDSRVAQRLRVKPTRTLSGVAPVTVLTMPYPCPGTCIFCPTDVRMPKSYLSNEPGAMRALMLDFDPFRQTYERIEAMRRLGHSVDKIELLILGGTWSSYPADYQTWFVRRCFDAMSGSGGAPDEGDNLAEMGTEAEEWDRLRTAQQRNEKAAQRNVGLVIETRPDHITEGEVVRLRRLGVTRVQLGVQTLNDAISRLNRRGETSADVRRAMRLLREAGFKVAIHVMPNLLGATVESDLADFERYWSDPALRPDEMKLYPTGLLRGTELYEHYERGEYRPYTEAELTELLMACKRMVPRYCRLNRVMRDIPAPEIAEGVITSNLRQIVQEKLQAAGTPCQCIRCREVKRQRVSADEITIDTTRYETDHSREVFIEAVTPDDRLAGFLRLSLPHGPGFIEEIEGAAMIRQVQVYGPAVALEDEAMGRAQHQGLGTRLVERAIEETRSAGYEQLAVIAAVGTRDYYRRHGFEVGELYMGRAI